MEMVRFHYQALYTRAVGREITTKKSFQQIMEQSSMNKYIPEVKISSFPYPLTACNTNFIDYEI
jgi:hypothetical protein